MDTGRASERAFRQRRILLGLLVAFGADADKLPRQHRSEFFPRRARVVDACRKLLAQLVQLLLGAGQVMLQPAGVPIECPPTFQALRRDPCLEVFELDARLCQLLAQRLDFKRPVSQELIHAGVA